MTPRQRDTLKHPDDPPDGTSVTDQAVSGVAWLTAQKWVIRLLGFVTIAVLTRLLDPEDFGAVAAAATVLSFFYLLSDFGFAAYIVQADRVDQRLLSTGFWFSSGAGLLLGAGLAAAAPLSSHIYQDETTSTILTVMALGVPVTALASVPTAILRRAMKFRLIAAQGAVAAILAQVVAIGLALGGFGAWALVGQALTSAAVGCVLAWRAARWRPSFLFSRRDFRVMARFGGQVLGVEFVAVFRIWAEAAIVAGALGIAALGYLSIAQRLVQILQELTGGALVPVSVVAFAKVRGSAERVKRAYLRSLKMTYALLSLPMMFVAVGAPLIVPVVFGEQWNQSIKLAQVLALAGVLTVGAALDHGLFYGMGRPGIWFAYALVVDAATLGATLVAVQSGLVAVVWAFLGVALAATIVRWPLVARLLGASLREVVAPFGFLMVALPVVGLVGTAVVVAIAPLPDIVGIVVAGGVVTLVHLLVMRWRLPGVVQDVRGLIARSRWARVLSRRRNSEGRAKPR